MRIESGTTGERRVRLLIFLIMCAVFAGWFGYDGVWGYPKKNLKWAMEAMSPRPAEPKTNPRATAENLGKVEVGMTQSQVQALLGEPLLRTDHRLKYVGRDFTMLFTIADAKVAAVTRVSAEKDVERQEVNLRVIESAIEQVRVGMTEDDLRTRLGAPSQVEPLTLWYVGPAAYARYPIEGGKVTAGLTVAVQREPSETDILVQRVLAGGLAILALGVLVKLIRVIRTRVILDEAGLTLNGRHVPWDTMVGLSDDEYKDKAWLDLEYEAGGQKRSLRLDSYHIARFDEIVQAICQRKGFPSPVAVPDQLAAGWDGPAADGKDPTAPDSQ